MYLLNQVYSLPLLKVSVGNFIKNSQVTLCTGIFSPSLIFSTILRCLINVGQSHFKIPAEYFGRGQIEQQTINAHIWIATLP